MILTFVCDESKIELLLALAVLESRLVPVLEILEATVVGDVVDKQDSVRAVNVLVEHGAAERLTADVVHREHHLSGAGQRDALHEEVDAQSLIVLTIELILSIPRRYRSLQMKKEKFNNCKLVVIIYRGANRFFQIQLRKSKLKSF